MRTVWVLALALACMVLPTGVYSAEQAVGASAETSSPAADSTKPVSVTVRVESGSIAGAASTASASEATAPSPGATAVVKFGTKKTQ